MQLPDDLHWAVLQYSLPRGLPFDEALARVVRLGLQMAEGRVKGARAVNASRTPEERVIAARAAARTRWSRR